ncbi:MBL fold metallo-hydrolase [candidate division KSB1 bacterium]
MMKRIKMIFLIFLSLVILISAGVFLFVTFAPQFGAKASGDRLIRIQNSPNYRNGKFVNPVNTSMRGSGSMLDAMRDYFKGGAGRVPDSEIPVSKVDTSNMRDESDTDLRITWLGHSTVLIGIEGNLVLIDPMFSHRASPVTFFGVKRFSKMLPITARDLPEIDAVLISHDHYDHLDYQTIKDIKDKVNRFYVPLGVGSHLERWGVQREKIIEHDWWEQSALNATLTFTATPARHFSGRGLTDRFGTLWCSWIIKSEKYSVFFGGDSGYFDGFREIGEKYGPFDITMLESGAYSRYWPSIHMVPEETVRAHLDLRGEILMPIHWGMFDLSLHTWNEPIKRLTVKAEKENVLIFTPVVGGSITIPGPVPVSKWWSFEHDQ